MATFAEFHPSYNMPSAHPGEFEMFAPDHPWSFEHSMAFAGSVSAGEHSFVDASANDHYPPQHHFHEPHDYSHDAARPAFHPSSPTGNYSPVASASGHFDSQHPPRLCSHAESIQSGMSSVMGSPMAHPFSHDWSRPQPVMHLSPEIVQHDASISVPSLLDLSGYQTLDKGCVDPHLVQPFSPTPTHYTGAQFPDPSLTMPHAPHHAMPSPAPSRTSIGSPRDAPGEISDPFSPSLYQQTPRSNSSQHPSPRGRLHSSTDSQRSHSMSSDDSTQDCCPIAGCHRVVKDLKSHMLTHQNERPEKCPIPTCEYHTKGFARKYDKNRHTLTHYKCNMVCGFCPGSGSCNEKSFNRADVFKRHLMGVHGVEQNPPNSRNKRPSTSTHPALGSRISGDCSTCGQTFPNAQLLYEHLDECVLRVVQQAEPSEAINELQLSSMSDNIDVRQTMEKHQLPAEVDMTASTSYHDEDDEDEHDNSKSAIVAHTPTSLMKSSQSGKGRLPKPTRSAPRSSLPSRTSSHLTPSGAITKPSSGGAGPRRGLTHSQHGVSLAPPPSAPNKPSRRRKDYPHSWTCAPEQMKMRKRVACVFDGPRRLNKDEMVLEHDLDRRVPLPIPDVPHSNPLPVLPRSAFVTELDMYTVIRAEGYHNATVEEKGPWRDEEYGHNFGF